MCWASSSSGGPRVVRQLLTCFHGAQVSQEGLLGGRAVHESHSPLLSPQRRRQTAEVPGVSRVAVPRWGAGPGGLDRCPLLAALSRHSPPAASVLRGLRRGEAGWSCRSAATAAGADRVSCRARRGPPQRARKRRTSWRETGPQAPWGQGNPQH